ncbi:MAG: SCO family protein [Sulfurimonas sp.]
MTRLILVLSLLISFVNADKLGTNERLGNMVPLDLTFINEKGKSVTLRKYMDGKPTILTLNYFRCAGICTPQLNDLARVFSSLELAENSDYKVLSVSFAESEPYQLAAAKRKNILASMTRPFVKDAWHFVIGENNSSGILAQSVGFSYEKEVSPTGLVEYIHPGVAIVLSPEGKVTRYLNGIDQLPFDVKMSLLEAADGKVGPTIAKTLLFCFAYDAENKKYVFMWEKVLGTGMTISVLLFFLYLLKTSRSQKNLPTREEYEREQKKKEEDHQIKGENDE